MVHCSGLTKCCYRWDLLAVSVRVCRDDAVHDNDTLCFDMTFIVDMMQKHCYHTGGSLCYVNRWLIEP